MYSTHTHKYTHIRTHLTIHIYTRVAHSLHSSAHALTLSPELVGSPWLRGIDFKFPPINPDTASIEAKDVA